MATRLPLPISSTCGCAQCERYRRELSLPREEPKPTYEWLTPKLPDVKEPSRRLFSVQQIVNAVINYENGCGPGKRDWLKRMLGIELNGSNQPVGTKKGNKLSWKTEYVVEVDMDEYARYYGVRPDVAEVQVNTAPYVRQRYTGADLPSWLTIRQITEEV